MIELDIAGTQTVGTRADQQDTAGMLRLGGRRDRALLIVADGLGGHTDGAVAARIVTDTFRERAEGGAFDVPARSRHALDDAIYEINRLILAARDPEDGERGSASTAVAAVIAEGRVRWISIGDSHLYIWRRGRLVKLNADHSQAGHMVRQGRSPNDPAVLAARSLLTSALTGDPIEEIDSPEHDVPLAIGDVILLASDGLNTLDTAEIGQAIERAVGSGAEAIANGLVSAVLAHGLWKQDNTTVIAARIHGSGAPASADDEVPQPPPSPVHKRQQRRRWHLAAGLVLLVAILASVILTQIP